jgi:hypothetical protein
VGPAEDNIYAQRVNASGQAQWTPDGVPVCTAVGGQFYPQVVSDGAGGAIITWQDYRTETTYDIYAQRVDAWGVVQWEADGVVICRAAWNQKNPRLVADAVGGAIITWEDGRVADSDIYAQRVSTLGVVHWRADGVDICVAGGDQDSPSLVSDGGDGAVITWRDERGNDTDIYAQRVDAFGLTQWARNGVVLCAAANTQDFPQCASDGAGGAIATWRDYRSGSNYDVYAQRVAASGVVPWTAGGVPVCTAAEHQWFPQLTSDGATGAIITWWDRRGETADVYAQRVNASGVMQWIADGVPICAAGGDQHHIRPISNGEGGAVLTWQDNRSGAYDVYAHRVHSDGTTPVFFLYASALGEQGRVTLSWRTAVNVPGSSFLIRRAESSDGEFRELDVRVREAADCSFSCVDHSVELGRTYWYTVMLSGSLGQEVYGPIRVFVAPVPRTYALYPGFPNPFNPFCTIRYDLPAEGRVILRVLDAGGRLVRTLVDDWQKAGSHSEAWDGRAGNGEELPSGVYFCCLSAGDFKAARKVVLLR